MKQELFFIYCYLWFYFFAVAYGWPHLFTLSSLFGGLHLDWFIHNSIPWNSDQDKSYKPSLGAAPPPPIYLAYHAGRWLLGWDFSPLHSYFIVRTASAKEVWWGQLISVCQPLILNFSKKKIIDNMIEVWRCVMLLCWSYDVNVHWYCASHSWVLPKRISSKLDPQSDSNFLLEARLIHGKLENYQW